MSANGITEHEGIVRVKWSISPSSNSEVSAEFSSGPRILDRNDPRNAVRAGLIRGTAWLSKKILEEPVFREVEVPMVPPSVSSEEEPRGPIRELPHANQPRRTRSPRRPPLLIAASARMVAMRNIGGGVLRSLKSGTEALSLFKTRTKGKKRK